VEQSSGLSSSLVFFAIIAVMRALLPLLIGAATLLAQTPPAAKAPPKAPSPAAGPSARLLNPALAKAKAPDLYRVKFTTTKGDFVVEVSRDSAPLGADRFYNLVRIGFFTNVSFYRVIAGALIQFGLSPFPAVSKAWSTAPIHDDPVKLHNVAGSITFAMGGPNTRTTQFFINLADNTPYDADGFAPIGKVTEGLDVVKSLYSGYGEMAEQPGGRGPSQQKTTSEGKPYLDKNFPLLDSIKSATVIFPEPVAPAAKKAPVPAATKK
jgi:peptidyl-prolyl cis-trans isomerase A (cyclophilin A)